MLSDRRMGLAAFAGFAFCVAAGIPTADSAKCGLCRKWMPTRAMRLATNAFAPRAGAWIRELIENDTRDFHQPVLPRMPRRFVQERQPAGRNDAASAGRNGFRPGVDASRPECTPSVRDVAPSAHGWAQHAMTCGSRLLWDDRSAV
jgi:hypothetical protein